MRGDMDRPPRNVVLKDMMSSTGDFVLKAVENATAAHQEALNGSTPDCGTESEQLMVKARNLGVKLPPVNAELERLQKLKAKLSDRLDMSEGTTTHGTTLGDVVLGSAQGDDGLPLLGNYRGVSVSLLRKANTIARHNDTAPMKAELRSWIEEAQHLHTRADRVLDEYGNDAKGAYGTSSAAVGYVSHRASDASHSGCDFSAPQLASMTATVRNALTSLDLIKGVVTGGVSPESLTALRKDDLLADAGGMSGVEDKSDREALEDAVSALRCDVGLFVEEVKRAPVGAFGRPQPHLASPSQRSNVQRSPQSDGDDGGVPEFVDTSVLPQEETYDFANLPGSNPILAAATATEKGIASAAENCGMSLSMEQIKEVLTEFYRQPRLAASAPLKKKHKLRLERRYIEALRREEEQVKKLRRRVYELQSEVECLQDDLAQQQRANVQAEEEAPEGTPLQIQNDRYKTIKSLVESLSAKRAKDLEAKAAEMEEHFNSVVQSNETSQVLFDRLQSDYHDLLQAVQMIRQQWAKKEEELALKERELAVLQQGRRRDDQLWRARLTEVVRTLVQAMTPLPGVFAGLHTLLQELDHQEALDALTGLLNPVLNMITTTIKYSPHESFRLTLTEVLQLLETYILEQNSGLSEKNLNPAKTEWTSELLEERARVMKQAVPCLHAHCNKLTEQLQEKLEVLATENRSKFRESRYIKNVIQYSCELIEKIITGASPIPEEGLGDKAMAFPPPEVAQNDKDYAYFWLDQKKMLEEALTSLNLFVIHGGARPNSVNTLVSVLGYWRANVDQPNGAHSKPAAAVPSIAAPEAPQSQVEEQDGQRSSTVTLRHTVRNSLEPR